MEEVVLRRDAVAAAWWSCLGGALVVAGAFFIIDSDGHVIAWTLAALFVVPSLYFLVQLVWPASIEVRLGRDSLRSRWLLRRRAVDWNEVHVAKVRRILGDPVLVVDVRRSEGGLDRIRIPLPVGTDLAQLHAFLGERLGRGDDRAT